jgi:hypothetical protein
MKIRRSRARWLGLLAMAAVLALQAFNSFACYGHDFRTFVSVTSSFIVVPLVPALVCVLLPNPLRAVAACVLFAPWLLLAYYTDCVRSYAGGGTSMIYVAVLLWGTVSSLVGAVVGGLAFKSMGVEVSDG